MSEIFNVNFILFQIYSLIFIFCAPITAALMPAVLFAILHAASFTLTILDQVSLLKFGNCCDQTTMVKLVDIYRKTAYYVIMLSKFHKYLYRVTFT
jgi:hypothetical protein